MKRQRVDWLAERIPNGPRAWMEARRRFGAREQFRPTHRRGPLEKPHERGHGLCEARWREDEGSSCFGLDEPRREQMASPLLRSASERATVVLAP